MTNPPAQVSPPGDLALSTLLAASSLTVMAGATIAPSLPALARDFSAIPEAEFLARLALTLPALVIALCAPFMGALVDLFGSRSVLFWSIVVYALGGSSGLWVQDLHSLLAGRVVLGAGVAGVIVATTTLIGDLYSAQDRDRVLSYQGAAMALGGVVFLTLGGWLADVGWRLPFAIYALPVGLLPAVLASLPRASAHHEVSPGNASQDDRLPRTRLLCLYGLAMVAMAIFYVIPTQMPFRLTAAGFDNAALAGYAIAASTFSSAIAALQFRRVKGWFPPTGAIAFIFLGLGLGLVATAASESFPILLAAMFVAGAGAGLTMPVLNSLVLDLAPNALRGRATGGLSTSIFLGQFLSPVFVTVLIPDDSVQGVFVGTGAFALLVGLGFLVVTFTTRLRHSGGTTERKLRNVQS